MADVRRELEDGTIELLRNVAPGEPAPLVIALHGRGGVPGLPSLSRVNGKVRVLALRGPHRLGPGFGWSRFSVLSGREESMTRELTESRDALLARLAQEAPSTMGPVTIVGYSQGAILGLALALGAPTRFGTAILGATWLPPGLEPTSWSGPHPRLRAYHGDADRVVALAGTQALASRLRALGVELELEVFPGVDHDASPAMGQLAAAWLGEALASDYARPVA